MDSGLDLLDLSGQGLVQVEDTGFLRLQRVDFFLESEDLVFAVLIFQVLPTGLSLHLSQFYFASLDLPL